MAPSEEKAAPEAEVVDHGDEKANPTEANNTAQPVASQSMSKKRGYFEITGAAELAAAEEARKADSVSGSKCVRLDDGTKKECTISKTISKSAETKSKVDVQE